MSMDQAKNFLMEMRTNEKVKEYLKGMEKPADENQAFAIYAQAAKYAGYDVTADELKEAALLRKQVLERKSDAASEEVEELKLEDLDEVAGGYYWAADDSKIDGHELFCMLFYHDIDWSKENNEWCTNNYITWELYQQLTRK